MFKLFTYNQDNIKKNILIKFIKYFIYSDFNNLPKQKQNDLILLTKDILKISNVIFGGDCVINNSSEIIDIYIKFDIIVDFLLAINDLNEIYNGPIKLFNNVSLNFMNTSEFNKYNPDSIYAINYDNSDNTNKLNIYVINDENIINKITDKYYDLEKDNIITSQVSQLTPSHKFKKRGQDDIQDDTEYKDVILEIITYIPYFINYEELDSKFLIIKNSRDSYIYNYPIIWFQLLIGIKKNYTYNSLCHSYGLLTSLDRTTKEKINFIITKIYINKILYKYNIYLHIEDNEIKFLKSEKIVDNNIKKFVKLLLLFYYVNKIYLGYNSEYKFIQTIHERNLPEIIFPIEELTTINDKTFTSIIELISHLLKNHYEFIDIIGFSDLNTVNEVNNYLHDTENENIFFIVASKVFGISKKSLETIIMNENNIWLIDCRSISRDKDENYYYEDLYIKLNFIAGDKYISYKYIYTLLNSTDKFYYIEDVGNTNTTSISYNNYAILRDYRLSLEDTIANELLNMDENHCNPGTLIKNIIILKKIKEAEATEEFSIIPHTDLSKIFNKKLKLSQSSKRPRRGGKKTI